MFEADPVFPLLARALDTAALRQAVHVANIANAGVSDYHRLEVRLDTPVELSLPSAPGELLQTAYEPNDGALSQDKPRVVSTNDSVRLDQEMALMAKDAIRYQMLLGAFERTTSLLDLAVREGRGG